MPRFKVAADTPPEFVFQPIGRNLATTFTGLCKNHDRELFGAIETNPVQLPDPRYRILLAYRAVVMEAQASRKSTIDPKLSYQKDIEKGIYPNYEPSRGLGCLLLKWRWMPTQVERVKRIFDKVFLRGDWDVLMNHVYCIDFRPKLAVNSMFSTDL